MGVIDAVERHQLDVSMIFVALATAQTGSAIGKRGIVIAREEEPEKSSIV